MKKQSLMTVFVASLAVCAASSAIAGVNIALTSQALESPAGAVFRMEEKAAVRIGDGTADDAGIRFRVVMDEAMKDYIVSNDGVEYGFLIFPQAYLGTGSETVTGDYHTNISKYVEIRGDKSKIYRDSDDNYYANGTVTRITDFELERTCVAYTYDGTSYEYATLDAEFSRSAHGVSSAAYLNESDKRDDLTAIYGLGTETTPVLIDSYENLSTLITEVNSINNTSFDGVNFKLNAHITLAEDYTMIPSKFKGKIDFGDYTVVKAQSQKFSELTGCLTNARYVEVKDDGTPYLVTIKGDDTDAKIYQNNLSPDKTRQTEEQVSALPTTGTYSGKALTFSLGGNDLSTYKETLNLAWTSKQLQALKQLGYRSVTFNFMVYHGAQASGALVGNTISNFTYLGQTYRYSDGKLQTYLTSDTVLWNQWYNVSLNIDEVAGKMTDKTLTVIENISKLGATPTFYFGEVSLSTNETTKEEFPPEATLLSVESAADASRIKDAKYQDNSVFSDPNTYTGNYKGNALTIGFLSDVTLRLDITKDDLTSLKSNYKTVKFNFMAYRTDLTPASTVGFTNFALVTYTQPSWKFNTWYEITVSIDDVIAAMTDNQLALIVGATKSGASPSYAFGNISLSDEEISYPDVKLLSVESANDMPSFGADWVYREKSYFDAYTIAGDYTGGAATKYNQTDVSVRLDMTKDELALFKSKYNAVKFNLMLFNSSLNPASEVNFTNFALVTYTQDVWNFNTWYEITVSIDDVIAAMEGNSLALVVGATKTGASPTFCFGDIVLTNA